MLDVVAAAAGFKREAVVQTWWRKSEFEEAQKGCLTEVWNSRGFG